MTKAEEQLLAEHIKEIINQANDQKEDAELKNHTTVEQEDGKFSVISPKGNVVAKDLTKEEAEETTNELDEILNKQNKKEEEKKSGTPQEEYPKRPANIGENDIVKDASDNGIYLVEIKDTEGNTFYVILNENGQTLTRAEDPNIADDEEFQAYDPNILYETYAEAKKIHDALVQRKIQEGGEYNFDGKVISNKTILVDRNGKKYEVITKGQPDSIKGKQSIQIRPEFNRSTVERIYSLSGYKLESEVEVKPTPKNPDAFRLTRLKELIQIYPHKSSGTETRESAEKRLEEFLVNTSKEMLAQGISISITKNLSKPESRMASDKNGQNVNNNLRVNPESYNIQVLYQGKPIGYIPNYNQYTYIDANGKEKSLDNITQQEFADIFDVQNKRDFSTEYENFKDNFKNSKKIYTTLTTEYEAANTPTVVIDNKKTSELLNFSHSSGEYAFVPRSRKQDRPKLNELDHKPKEGTYYIIDRRRRYNKDGTFTTDDIVKSDIIDEALLKQINSKIKKARYTEDGEDKLARMGRYIAVVELPNGEIKFVELTSAKVEKETLDGLVDEINSKSAELKADNLEEVMENNKPILKGKDPFASSQINEKLNKTFYVATDIRGMTVNVTLQPNGNIKVEFIYLFKDKTKLKADIYIKEASQNDKTPLKLKDSLDLIERINNKIEEYNKLQESLPFKKGVLKSINLKLSPSSFVQNIEIGDENFQDLLAGTERSVVKNANLSVYSAIKEEEKNKTSDTLTAIVNGTDDILISEEEVANQQATIDALKALQQKKQAKAAPVSTDDNTKTPSKGFNERLNNYGLTKIVIPSNYYEGDTPKGRLSAFQFAVAQVAENIQVLDSGGTQFDEFDFISSEDKQRLRALLPKVLEFQNLNINVVSLTGTRTVASEKRFVQLYNEIASEFVDIMGKHVEQQLGKKITSSKPRTSGVSTDAKADIGTTAEVGAKPLNPAQELLSKRTSLQQQKTQLIKDLPKKYADLTGRARMEAIENDPELISINTQIDQIDAQLKASGTAKKVSNNLSTDDITNINEFTNWVKTHLPDFISIEDIKIMRENMKKNGTTVGMFYLHMNSLRDRLEGRIAVGEKTPFKYHEAFHAIFRMLLTDSKINQLLDIAKKELREQGKNIQTEKKKLLESDPTFYSQLTEEELEERVYEEYIADKFDAWKKNVKVETSPVNKGFFRKLLDFIRNFFKSLKGSNNSLEDFFMSIEKGKYRKSQIASNKFTEGARIGITTPALKSVQIGTDFILNEDNEVEEIPVFLSQEEGNVLSSTIAAVFHKRMQEAGLRQFNEDILDEVITQYSDLYNRDVNKYYSSDEFYEKYQDNPEEYFKVKKRIDNRLNIFTDPDLIKIFKDAAMVHINLMGYKESLEEDEFDKMVDEYGDRATVDNRKESYSIGGYGSLSRELRLYLSTIVEEKIDEFGNSVFVDSKGNATEEKLIEAANANVLYNGILKAVSGSINQKQLLNKLKAFAKYNPEANKFWNKFKKDVGLVFDSEGNFDVKNKKQATLFQAVVSGFMQYNVTSFFLNKDINNGTIRIFDANMRGAAKNQFSMWYNKYSINFAQKLYSIEKDRESLEDFISEKTLGLKSLANLLRKSSVITSTKILDEQIEKIKNSISENLGINLSPLFIRYSFLSKLDPSIFESDTWKEEENILTSFQGVRPMTAEDIDEIIAVIKSLKNPFGDNIDPTKLAEAEEQVKVMQSHETPKEEAELTADDQDDEREEDNDLDGARGRILNIAEANAIFDEQVSSTSHKNAENELVFSHRLPTFDLVRASEIATESFREELKKNKFLEDNYLLNNPFFQHIANSFKIFQVDGIKDSYLTQNEDGKLVENKTLQRNQNKGVTYGRMSPREFLVTQLELYGKNRKFVVDGKPFMTSMSLLGVMAEKNTGNLVELPVIKTIETNRKGELTLTNEAKEFFFNEVMREYKRIIRVKQEFDERFPNGVIENYHNGNPAEGGMKGLRFIKMKNMLGDLVEDLEKAAQSGIEELSADEKATILNQIERYLITDPNSQLNNFIEDLIKEGIVYKYKTAEGEERYGNNLLSSFIMRGATSNGKVDEDTNFLLNLRATDPIYNIAQIYINNFINTTSVQQLFIGDVAQNGYKDDEGVDEVKRNAGRNGSGPSAYSSITAPQLGITHANKTSHVVVHTDSKYDGKYKGKKDSKEDAQTRITVKGLRYMLFGFGKLNQAQAELLDKIEKGENVSVSDIFGDRVRTQNGVIKVKGGSIKYNAQTNSIKIVYNDGKTYIKTSAYVLTKQLTSLPDETKPSGWSARPGYEELHKLREKLEEFEARNQTITFALPKSASKGMTKNMAASMSAIKDENFTQLDNRFWRLQLENPSNKIKITDPTQAKQIILSEQDDSLEVVFMGQDKDANGKPFTIGKLKELYNKDTAQRIKNNYFSARNQIFSIDEGYRELTKSIDQNKITPKLGVFLKNAVKTLQSTGADPQTIEFFTPKYNKETGEYTPIYDLNHPMLLEKFTQLFLAHFSKEVMSEKVPGDSLALMSNYGIKVVKRVISLDENGQPKEWEVITRQQYENDKNLLNQIRNAKIWNNELDRQFDGLKKGDYYIDDLRHNVPEYDKQGKIVGYYTEFMLPPLKREDMEEYLKTGTISKEVQKAFGARIPSQDKHSFVTLRAVDFLPAFYGSNGVFPHELIEISGADFDIDKVYNHMYDTYVKNGKRVAYGTETSKEGKFQEFLTWTSKNNKAFIDINSRLRSVDKSYQESLKKLKQLKTLRAEFKKALDFIPESEKQIRDAFKSAISASRLFDDIAPDKWSLDIEESSFKNDYTLEEVTFVNDLKVLLDNLSKREIKLLERDYGIEMTPVFISTFESIKDVIKEISDHESRIASQVLRALGLPADVESYSKSKVELNNGVLNNRILEAKMLLLSNKHLVESKDGTTPIAFQVAETKPLEDLVKSFVKRFKELHDILLEEGTDVDSMRGQYKAFKNNKEGSRNIGPAVNAMQDYSIFNTYGVKIRKVDSKGNPLFVLTIDGNEFDSYGNTRAWNVEKKEYNGERIMYNISALVSAMTDNAKERLAARLGLNINAVSVVANMVALGVPLETAILFNLQPSVRDFYKKIQIATNNIKSGEENLIRKSEVGNKILELLQSIRSEKEENRVLYPITTELLTNNIQANGVNPNIDEFVNSADVEYSIFKEFFDFYKQTEYFNSASTIVKLSQGLGTSNENIDKVDEVEEQLGLRLSDTEFLETSIPFDLRQAFLGINPSKPFSDILATGIKIKDEIKQLQKSIMIERSYLYNRIKDAINENLSVNKKEKEKFDKDLKKDIIAYLGIKAYMQYLKANGKGAKLSGLDNALIYDAEALQRGEEYEDIVDAVNQMRILMPGNYFAEYINAVPIVLKDIESGQTFLNPKGKKGINTVVVNTWAKLDAAEINKIQDSLIDLYSNSETRPYVYKLFNYLLVKDGGQFKSESFIRFMPPALFKDLLDATGVAQKLLKFDNIVGNEEIYKEIFGMSAVELFNEAVRLYTTNINKAFEIKIVGKQQKLPEKIELPEENYKPEVITVDEKEGILKIDMFGGIRKAELTLLEDEYGNTFYDEVIKTGKFSDLEKKKLSYNLAILEANKFKLERRTDDKGKERVYVQLPHTLKVNMATGIEEGNRYVYFKLSEVAKRKGQKSFSGFTSFILEPEDNMALSSLGVYKAFEPEGSKGQWAFGGATGNMPKNSFLRDRYIRSKQKDFDIEDDIARIESQLEGVASELLQQPVQDLDRYYQIQTVFTNNSFSYFKKENGKLVPFDPMGTKSPQELLEKLDAMNNVNKEERAKNSDPLSKYYTPGPSIPGEDFGDIGDISMEDAPSEEEQKKASEVLKRFMANPKLNNEVKQQKDDKDKGCNIS
jgi:hypothetical protein